MGGPTPSRGQLAEPFRGAALRGRPASDPRTRADPHRNRWLRGPFQQSIAHVFPSAGRPVPRVTGRRARVAAGPPDIAVPVGRDAYALLVHPARDPRSTTPAMRAAVEADAGSSRREGHRPDPRPDSQRTRETDPWRSARCSRRQRASTSVSAPRRGGVLSTTGCRSALRGGAPTPGRPGGVGVDADQDRHGSRPQPHEVALHGQPGEVAGAAPHVLPPPLDLSAGRARSPAPSRAGDAT